MEIIFKTKDFSLTQSVEEYVRKKIASLEKFLKRFNEGLIRVEVELGQTTSRHRAGDIFRAEINLSAGKKLFRAESEQADIFSAIDEVRDDLEQEIKKDKDKRETIFLRGARSIKKKFGLSGLARFKKQ